MSVTVKHEECVMLLQSQNGVQNGLNVRKDVPVPHLLQAAMSHFSKFLNFAIMLKLQSHYSYTFSNNRNQLKNCKMENYFSVFWWRIAKTFTLRQLMTHSPVSFVHLSNGSIIGWMRYLEPSWLFWRYMLDIQLQATLRNCLATCLSCMCINSSNWKHNKVEFRICIWFNQLSILNNSDFNNSDFGQWHFSRYN